MKKSICHAMFVTVLSACAIIGLSACAMQTESDETSVDETSSVRVEKTEPTTSSTVEPEEIAVDPTVITVNPAKLPPARTLDVAVDHATVIKISDADLNLVAEQHSADCPVREDGYYVCSLRLGAGEYIIDFGRVANYEAPDSVAVNLKAGSTIITGTYSETPAPAQPPAKSLGLPGIGDEIAF